MWDLPGPGTELLSSALADGFVSTGWVHREGSPRRPVLKVSLGNNFCLFTFPVLYSLKCCCFFSPPLEILAAPNITKKWCNESYSFMEWEVRSLFTEDIKYELEIQKVSMPPRGGHLLWFDAQDSGVFRVVKASEEKRNRKISDCGETRSDWLFGTPPAVCRLRHPLQCWGCEFNAWLGT